MPEFYLYQLIIQLNMVFQLVISALIFYIPLKRRRLFPLRLMIAAAICAVILALSVLLRVRVNSLTTRFVMRLMQFSVPLVFGLVAYDGSLPVKLKAWCAGIAAMEIGAAVFTFILAFIGVDERETISFYARPVEVVDWAIYYVIHVALYALIYHFFWQINTEELDRTSRNSTVILAVVCLLFLTVPDCMSNEYRMVSYPLFLVNRIYLLALAVFILAICTSIEFQSRYRADMEIMDQVLREERKQYEKMKENMDVINMRCHDLRHQLDDFAGKLTDREIESLRESMDFYDSNLKTGCEVLDVVLHTSQLTAKEEGIEITCLADGALLGFMRTRHLYSLFNNAIGNAIEAVRKLPEPEKRIIGITVERQGGSVVIEVTNYFDGHPSAPGETTKNDRSHHGFGTMSMRYIAESYGGRLTVNTAGELYCLNITIPLPDGF